MRVFELMEQLSRMPAGAEVEVSMLVTVEELIKNDVIECDGEVSYSLKTSIVEVEKVSNGEIYIYTD